MANTYSPLPYDFHGFLFDIYNVGSDVYIWLLDDDRRLFLCIDRVYPVIYAHGSPHLMQKLAARFREMGVLAAEPCFETKQLFYENIPVSALKLSISDPSILPGVKKKLFTLYQKFDIYHSDIDPIAAYLVENDLYPLAPVRVRTRILDRANRVQSIEVLESSRNFEYRFPALRILQMSLKFSHRLGMGYHNPLILRIETREYCIAEKKPENYIHKINAVMRAENPDCILSSFGDQIIFPFLFATAQEHKLTLELDRDLTTGVTRRIRRKGSSFNTYGSLIFRAASYPLNGRWHIDQQNSFTFKHTDLAGTIELARISRMPVQRSARASTGNALTEMEMDYASKKNYLVPWQKSALENRKTWYELQLYDKGGLVFQPNISSGNVYHNVAQLDFSQMYPSIMHIHNISPETINCPCCAGEPNLPRVPEINYHICVKRRGVVSDSLEHILARRKYYKQKLKENLTTTERTIYEQRIDSLKWLNVVSFGYLGFRNAKFGKLESHESVTAFGRDKLLTATRLAEEFGFEVLHAIVDCIFIKRFDGLKIEQAELDALSAAIFKETLVEMSTDGIFSWALFLPARSDVKMPVANRYLGRFTTGKLKMRGIVARRKDAPEFIGNFQRQILALMQDSETANDIRERFPEAQEIYNAHLKQIETGEIEWPKLLIRRTVSHELDDYQVMNGTSLTMNQLKDMGLTVSPGEKVRFIVVNRKFPDRSRRYLSEEKAAQTGKNFLTFDKAYYAAEIFAAFSEIFQPFVSFDLSRCLDSVSGISGVTQQFFAFDQI